MCGATINRLICLAGAIILAEGDFNETPVQQQERRELIGLVVGTEQTAQEWLSSGEPIKMQTVPHAWKRLMPKVLPACDARGVTLGDFTRVMIEGGPLAAS